MSAAEIAFDLSEVIETEEEDSEQFFEMANIRQKNTGLPMVIWVSEKGTSKHGPRVKVSRTHNSKVNIADTVSVSVSDNPQIAAGAGLDSSDFLLVRKYIILNKKVILDYWNGETDTYELLERLRKI